ncbi:MAG: nucleoside 2-deoxyribosyltransferase [Patescibacteria group bacterium]
MNIYFAGSIRGGRQDIELYQEIIDLLVKHGKVLTEHVGDSDLNITESGWSQEKIYNYDMDMLRRSEVMVAEVSTPSLGVGYEIARFEGKPILCLVKESVGNNLSSMIAGNPNLTIFKYKNIEDIQKIIEDYFTNL